VVVIRSGLAVLFNVSTALGEKMAAPITEAAIFYY
jgi:hypothetical protein